MGLQPKEATEPVSRQPQPGIGNKRGALRHEATLLIIGLVAFFLLNLFTADKTPAVWCDEVMYQDPAVNLFQGHGFCSGAWFAQDMNKFWAGNVPLYQSVLFMWLKAFGFSLRSVRSLHYALVCFGVFLAWVGVRRLGLIAQPAHRLFFCAVICLSSGVTFVYRSARPESLGICLVAFTFLAFSFKPRGLCCMVLVFAGVLLTWCGLQLAVYAGLIGALAVASGMRQQLAGFFALGAGCILGGCLLFLFYQHFGVWDDFVRSVRHFTIANQHTEYAHIRAYGTGLHGKLRQVPKLYMDYSFIPFFAGAFWMAFQLFRARLFQWKSALGFGIIASLVIPLGLHIVGVFPIYYFWMSFVPLALGVCAGLGPWLRLSTGTLGRLSLAALFLCGCMMGLPRRLIEASPEWSARSYVPVEKLAAPYVSGEKLVYTDFGGYYAAKQNSARVVLPTYSHLLTEAEKRQITVAIVNSQTARGLADSFGGQWRDTGAALHPSSASFFGIHEQLDSRQYELRVFVREP